MALLASRSGDHSEARGRVQLKNRNNGLRKGLTN